MRFVPGKAGAVTRLRKDVRNRAYEETARPQKSLKLVYSSIGVNKMLKSLEADNSIDRALSDMQRQILHIKVVMEKMDVGPTALLCGQLYQIRATIDSDNSSGNIAELQRPVSHAAGDIGYDSDSRILHPEEVRSKEVATQVLSLSPEVAVVDVK